MAGRRRGDDPEPRGDMLPRGLRVGENTGRRTDGLQREGELDAGNEERRRPLRSRYRAVAGRRTSKPLHERVEIPFNKNGYFVFNEDTIRLKYRSTAAQNNIDFFQNWKLDREYATKNVLRKF